MRGLGPDVFSFFGLVHWDSAVGLLLLWYSVVCTVESLSFVLDLYVIGDDASIS